MDIQESLKLLSDAVKHLYDSVRLDDKTPLKNSFALNEAVESFAENEGIPNIVVFGDINKFKNINTRFGTTKGDFAIYKIGEMIDKHFVKPFGIEAFHISGDEFILLLEATNLESFKKTCVTLAD